MKGWISLDLTCITSQMTHAARRTCTTVGREVTNRCAQRSQRSGSGASGLGGNPTPRGCTGGSDTGNMCVLGFNPAQYLTGRSPLEAASLGIKMEKDDVALRANLVTLSGDGPYEQKIMEDYSADEISTEEAAQLIACLEQHFGSETLRFYPGFSYRHCVIMHHATANEQLTPPHNITGRCIKDYMPKGDYANMLTDIMHPQQ